MLNLDYIVSMKYISWLINLNIQDVPRELEDLDYYNFQIWQRINERKAVGTKLFYCSNWPLSKIYLIKSAKHKEWCNCSFRHFWCSRWSRPTWELEYRPKCTWGVSAKILQTNQGFLLWMYCKRIKVFFCECSISFTF